MLKYVCYSPILIGYEAAPQTFTKGNEAEGDACSVHITQYQFIIWCEFIVILITTIEINTEPLQRKAISHMPEVDNVIFSIQAPNCLTSFTF